MIEEQKNRDFIQLYRDHVDDVAKLARDNGKAYDLFMLLISTWTEQMPFAYQIKHCKNYYLALNRLFARQLIIFVTMVGYAF